MCWRWALPWSSRNILRHAQRAPPSNLLHSKAVRRLRLVVRKTQPAGHACCNLHLRSGTGGPRHREAPAFPYHWHRVSRRSRARILGTRLDVRRIDYGGMPQPGAHSMESIGSRAAIAQCGLGADAGGMAPVGADANLRCVCENTGRPLARVHGALNGSAVAAFLLRQWRAAAYVVAQHQGRAHGDG